MENNAFVLRLHQETSSQNVCVL